MFTSAEGKFISVSEAEAVLIACVCFCRVFFLQNANSSAKHSSENELSNRSVNKGC